MTDDPVFNPLDKRNLGNSVVEALIDSPERPLNEASLFPGAGVYAIYYRAPEPKAA